MPDSPSKRQVFLQRLGSTIGLWTIVLLALFAPNPDLAHGAFALIVAILGILAYREYADLVERTTATIFRVPAIVAGLAFLAFELGWGQDALATAAAIGTPSATETVHTTVILQTGTHTTLIPALLLLWLTTLKLRSAGRVPLASLALTFFGWFYVFGLLSFIAKIYYLPSVSGSWFLLYFILVTKFSDLGAYLTGSLFGKHKMAPKISPGKTWEGFGGALLVSLLVSLITVYASGSALAPLRGIHAVVLGLLLSALAVAGDLVESLMKRETGAKDSGALFPGIGGCLDLVDSLLFNAPIFYLYCRLTVIG